MKRLRVISYLAIGLIVLITANRGEATLPELQTPAPVIYLVDNLDEQDKLGWCIDTVGRGLSDRLHAHSCKPHGGDVQFKFAAASGQLQSATFDGKCAALQAAAAPGVKFGLVTCDGSEENQRFIYDAAKMRFNPKGNTALCLAVGGSSRIAGPFMSRNLELANCAATEAKFLTWRIKQ